MTVKTVEGKITATKHTLNFLSIVLSEAREQYNAKGYKGLAKTCDDMQQQIYDALKESGLYDEL